MYYITIHRKGETYRITDYEKRLLDASTAALLEKLHLILSDEQLNEIDLQGKYIEINADSENFEYSIKDKPIKQK